MNLGIVKDEVLCVAIMDQMKVDQMHCQHTFEKLKLINSKSENPGQNRNLGNPKFRVPTSKIKSKIEFGSCKKFLLTQKSASLTDF